MTTDAKTCASCTDSSCAAKSQQPGEQLEAFLERQALAERMCQIKHKIIVMSGKGGVGKSTVAVNLAVALARSGQRVGLLDVDIHGPSIPTLLNLKNTQVQVVDGNIQPIETRGLKVMSIGLALPDADAAIIWRGPMKTNMIKQFLKDVAWGDLDYLIIDSPPGTGDEPLSVCQLIGNVDGTVIVTTPQELALADVRRSVTFCRQLKLPISGIIENMSGFICPKCGEKVDIFKQGGGEKLAEEMKLHFLGRIPLDPAIVQTGDTGQPAAGEKTDSPLAKSFRNIANAMQNELKQSPKE